MSNIKDKYTIDDFIKSFDKSLKMNYNFVEFYNYIHDLVMDKSLTEDELYNILYKVFEKGKLKIDK